MPPDSQLLSIVGVGMLFFLGIYGMKHFKNTVLQLLSFIISVLVAASIAGYLGLVQSTLVVFTLAGLVVLLVVLFLAYTIIRHICDTLASRRRTLISPSWGNIGSRADDMFPLT